MITADEKERLQRFIGYGRLDAPVWFLGMEEAGGGEERLKLRATFSQVEDLRSAQTALGYGFHFDGQRKIQPQWGRMADVMLRVNGVANPNTEDRRQYQANQLGRLDGETLLTDLMFIPKPSLREWDYPLSFPEFPNAEAFYASALKIRTKFLSNLIQKHRPKVVVAYGGTFWPYFRDLMVESNEYVERGFRVRQSGNTLLVLTPLLSHRTMNYRHSIVAEIIRERMSE